eukprot:4052745-Amphidinium_carterae.1
MAGGPYGLSFLSNGPWNGTSCLKGVGDGRTLFRKGPLAQVLSIQKWDVSLYRGFSVLRV